MKQILKLDCTKIKTVFGWKPYWDVNEAIEKTIEWTRVFLTNRDICGIMTSQITTYLKAQEQC